MCKSCNCGKDKTFNDTELRKLLKARDCVSTLIQIGWKLPADDVTMTWESILDEINYRIDTLVKTI